MSERQIGEAPEAPVCKGDGETWEAYARRLEKRIDAQREHIRAISALREVPGDKKARARIAALERALGRMTLRWYRERECREALTQTAVPSPKSVSDGAGTDTRAGQTDG